MSQERVSEGRAHGGAPVGVLETGELPPIVRDPSIPIPRPRFRPVHLTLKTVLFFAAVWVFVLPLVPNFQSAVKRLRTVEPALLGVAFALQLASWFAYSLLTRAALGEAGRGVSRMRFFRIQMSTKSLSNIIPGGSAASSALGYRLLTLSGISGPDAGFALATAGLGSAVVLNLIFWLALLVSIPIRGVNPGYAAGAMAGVVIMLLAAGLVLGIVHGQRRAEQVLRWICSKVHLDGDRAAAVLRQIGDRLEVLVSDRSLLKLVVGWAAVNWLLDAASLWVFLRAFNETLDLDALLVAFGLANVLAVIPITPGGLGIVDAYYITTLVAFGITRRGATLGVASYRMAQFFLPIVLGGLLYGSLRVGPWRIERRDRLARLRDIARSSEQPDSETRVDFALRKWERTTKLETSPPLPPFDESGEPAELEATGAVGEWGILGASGELGVVGGPGAGSEPEEAAAPDGPGPGPAPDVTVSDVAAGDGEPADGDR